MKKETTKQTKTHTEEGEVQRERESDRGESRGRVSEREKWGASWIEGALSEATSPLGFPQAKRFESILVSFCSFLKKKRKKKKQNDSYVVPSQLGGGEADKTYDHIIYIFLTLQK